MDAQQIDFLELLNKQVQYVVPRWQCRYRWGQSDIERLVEDLLTVAVAGPEERHYSGTLLTFPEPGAGGGGDDYRVVDGQQRLTTVSIVLTCIAAELGPEGQCGDWAAQIIRDGGGPDRVSPTSSSISTALWNGYEVCRPIIGVAGCPIGNRSCCLLVLRPSRIVRSPRCRGVQAGRPKRTTRSSSPRPPGCAGRRRRKSVPRVFRSSCSRASIPPCEFRFRRSCCEACLPRAEVGANLSGLGPLRIGQSFASSSGVTTCPRLACRLHFSTLAAYNSNYKRSGS